MQPPEFNPGYLPKKRGLSPLLWILLGGAACCILLVVGFGGFGYYFFAKNRSSINCMLSLSVYQQGLRKYIDAKGRLPDAGKWQDEVKPYLDKSLAKGQKVFLGVKLPNPNGPAQCQVGTQPTEFAFNDAVSGKKLGAVQHSHSTVMLFEEPGSSYDAHGPYKPLSSRNSPTMMGRRRGWFIVTVDGMMFLHTDAGNRPMQNGQFQFNSN